MSLSKEQRIFAQHFGWLLMYAYSQGYEVTFGEAWRSNPEQERLYLSGLSKIRQGGNHGKRLAVDLNLFKNGQLTWKWEDFKVLGDYWESLDPKNRWGGDWNNNDKIDKGEFVDAPHFERNLG